ncbi:MAG: EAL domain-containing protein [Pseudomonadota bacterium]
MPSQPSTRDDLAQLIDDGRLYPVFQPLVSMETGQVYAYEALIRGPDGSEFHRPDRLFGAARAHGLTGRLEIACCETAIRGFAKLALPGKLFLNAGAPAIERFGAHQGGELVRAAIEAGFPPNRIVLELTEHERVESTDRLLASLATLRALGVCLALDDFGDGRSSLRLWAEIRPDMVKIDSYFTRDIQADSRKVEFLKAMLRLSDVFGSPLVAEGIETEAELAILRDLGVAYGQGYFLGRPDKRPDAAIPAYAAAVLESHKIAVYPETPPRQSVKATVEKLLVTAPSVTPGTPNDALVGIFASYPELHALAVVDHERPVGLINRHGFMDRYSRPFHREIYGKRPCTTFMNPAPLLIERSTPLDCLDSVLTGEDQRYLSDGYIITDGGRYLGIGTGESLVRAVTELRVEAARHANPLTFLPGNIPITEHISRLLSSGVPFCAAYFDLNNFKPFNDQYGYWRGDEMIKLAAGIIASRCDPLRDFVGHVGGDDFVVLFQSDDWHARCMLIVRDFNERARRFFDAEDVIAGGITGEDRHGNRSFFPLTTIAAGAVRVSPGDYKNPEEVASAAAAAKRRAKHSGSGIFVARRPCPMAAGARTRP